jgi:hypothetical protein
MSTVQGGDGGAIAGFEESTLTLTDLIAADGSAAAGGATAAYGQLTCDSCHFLNNTGVL